MSRILNLIDKNLSKVLPEKIMKIIRNFLSAEFITFLIVGVVNTLSTSVISTVLDFITSNMFSENISEIISKFNITFITGYLLSLVLSFFLNCRFTFKEKPDLKKFIKFPISYIPNFIIQYICVGIFKFFGLKSSLAYIVAAIVGIPVTFLTMKIIVFAKKKR